MSVVQIGLFILVGISGTIVVLTKEPLRQCITMGFFGLLLTLMFFVIHSMDVALASAAVSAVGMPVMILLALAKIRGHDDEH